MANASNSYNVAINEYKYQGFDAVWFFEVVGRKFEQIDHPL